MWDRLEPERLLGSVWAATTEGLKVHTFFSGPSQAELKAFAKPTEPDTVLRRIVRGVDKGQPQPHLLVPPAPLAQGSSREDICRGWQRVGCPGIHTLWGHTAPTPQTPNPGEEVALALDHLAEPHGPAHVVWGSCDVHRGDLVAFG